MEGRPPNKATTGRPAGLSVEMEWSFAIPRDSGGSRSIVDATPTPIRVDFHDGLRDPASVRTEVALIYVARLSDQEGPDSADAIFGGPRDEREVPANSTAVACGQHSEVVPKQRPRLEPG